MLGENHPATGIASSDDAIGNGNGLQCARGGVAGNAQQSQGGVDRQDIDNESKDNLSGAAPVRLHEQRISRLERQIAEAVTIRLLGWAFRALGTSHKALRVVLWLLRIYPHRGVSKQLIVGWLQRYLGPGGPGTELLRRIAAAPASQRQRYLARAIMTFIFHDLDTEYTMPNGRKIHAPATILLTPSQRCPLRCRGCYAGNYSRKDDLPTGVVWRVIEEARALGTHYFIILGGEPMVWEPLWETAARYPDCAFQFYTSGHLLDQTAARRIAKLGNLFPCVSIEGFESETNWRRGKGGFARAVAAMEALHAENVLFGYSVTVTHRNVRDVVGDEFVDFLIAKGAVVGWYFLYMPIGFYPDVGLMPTAEDRNLVREGTHHIRSTRPLLAADFWGDGPLTEGCLAGGRRYLHINNYGDVEPCIFIHFATSNIKECSLAEALASDFFQAFQRSAPWSTNLLRPCPIIDHPQILRGLVKHYKARGTHPGAESLVTDDMFTRHLDAYAKAVQNLYDPVYARDYGWAGALLGKSRYDWSGNIPAPSDVSLPELEARGESETRTEKTSVLSNGGG